MADQQNVPQGDKPKRVIMPAPLREDLVTTLWEAIQTYIDRPIPVGPGRPSRAELFSQRRGLRAWPKAKKDWKAASTRAGEMKKEGVSPGFPANAIPAAEAEDLVKKLHREWFNAGRPFAESASRRKTREMKNLKKENQEKNEELAEKDAEIQRLREILESFGFDPDDDYDEDEDEDDESEDEEPSNFPKKDHDDDPPCPPVPSCSAPISVV